MCWCLALGIIYINALQMTVDSIFSQHSVYRIQVTILIRFWRKVCVVRARARTNSLSKYISKIHTDTQMKCSMHINSLELCMLRFLFSDNGVRLEFSCRHRTKNSLNHTPKTPTHNTLCPAFAFISIDFYWNNSCVIIFLFAISYQTTMKWTRFGYIERATNTNCVCVPFSFHCFSILGSTRKSNERDPKINLQNNKFIFIHCEKQKKRELTRNS